MAPQAAGPAAGTWDEDPAGASIVLATGRARHDLLVVADPALLQELDEAWGRPASRVRLSFLPGVSAPGAPGDEDALWSYDRGGLGVLVARGRTRAHEGKPARRTTSLARIAAGASIRAALFVTRASSLGGLAVGDLVAVEDHLNLTGAPLFPADALVEGSWDEPFTTAVAGLDGVAGSGVLALAPGPVRPGRAESSVLAGLGADAVVTDSVAEAMTLATRGIRVAGLALIDHEAPTARPGSGRRAAGRRAASPAATTAVIPVQERRPAPIVVRAAIESILTALR